MAGWHRHHHRDDEGEGLMFEMRMESPGTVALSGRLDAAESDRALATLTPLAGPLVLDCDKLEYISSAGIAVIMQTYKRLLAGGQTLRMTRLSPRVRNVFVYAGLAELLGIE